MVKIITKTIKRIKHRDRVRQGTKFVVKKEIKRINQRNLEKQLTKCAKEVKSSQIETYNDKSKPKGKVVKGLYDRIGIDRIC